jgi:pimeloyl-ACP methyl ester carboxylesterase
LLDTPSSSWVDQVITFIEEVILPEHEIDGIGPKKVHIVGNSVGGHLAAHIANLRPDLVESLCLLNPTPVWGLNLPGWSGHLPAPIIPKAIGRFLFDRIRDLNTIEKYLENAYARSEAFGEELVRCQFLNGSLVLVRCKYPHSALWNAHRWIKSVAAL